MNFEKETTEVSTSSNQPIFVMILIIALSGGCFYYFSQTIKQSISNMLNNSEVTFQIPPEPKINFDFLKSDDFKNLESFPVYSSFQASEKIEIKIGRSNPFVPYGGYATPAEEQVPQVQEGPQAAPEASVPTAPVNQ
ncbi:MAG: hypothetical protein PHW52_00230 [Candidatus Pacebacteria bacterium]|nr:hypothetical protein [Candidatus Paceibacterota bacterium]